MTGTPLEQKALEAGDHLRDGTVVLSVDSEKNEALFVPKHIFGGEAMLGGQDIVVSDANTLAFHGHKDWRRLTDAESETLSRVWDKVAPVFMQGYNAQRFWADSPYHDHLFGRVRQGGKAEYRDSFRLTPRPVPIIRSGPALV